MGSSIADKGSQCARVFVTIEHENPIPNPCPSSSRKSDLSWLPRPSLAFLAAAFPMFHHFIRDLNEQ
jgi:hypothetical protein